jgi:integrase
MLLYGWASGGRRRTEIANLRMDQLEPTDHGYLVALGVTKTRDAAAAARDDKLVPLKGQAAQALDAWCLAAGIDQGRVFRSVGKAGRIAEKISDKTVNRVVKQRALEAGVVTAAEADRISAHGLRAGFLTEAARQNITMIDAMQMSDHASERSVVGYWQAQEVMRNPAGDMLARADAPARETGVAESHTDT